MRFVIPALLALAAGAASAQTIRVDPANRAIRPDWRALPVHVGGRAKVAALGTPLPSGARAFVHEWPGIYFETAFSGRAFALKFDDEMNEYRLLVDDRQPIALAQPGHVEVVVGGLAPGPHRLRLEKVTESIGIVRAFDGFYAPPAAQPLPLAQRRRQIEFVGDSSMSGYGDRSPVRVCTKEEVRLRTDTQNAYPALVAKHFDADYQVNAISGRGMVRNYENSLPGSPLPAVYPYVLSDEKTVYADPAWRPQIIVLKLNADFFGTLQPGEKWKTLDALMADYVAGTGQFLAELHRRSPDAAFLIWFGSNMMPNAEAAAAAGSAQGEILHAAKQAGILHVEFLAPPNLRFDASACDSHPSLDDSRRLADWMISYLDAHNDFWSGQDGGTQTSPASPVR